MHSDYRSRITTAERSLHGKSLRQRAEALAAIAHPKFRDDLVSHLPFPQDCTVISQQLVWNWP